MKSYSLKSKFIIFLLIISFGISAVIQPEVIADSNNYLFDEMEGFKVKNVSVNKGISEANGWLNDISDSLNGDIIAYEYINQSSVENNTADLLIDRNMETYVSFDALRDLQITHNFSGTIEGIEIFYVPKSESIGETIKVTGNKLTQTLNTFTVQGEVDELTSVFVPLNYETNGDKLRIYSGGTYGYALDIYEIKIYSSSDGTLNLNTITDGIVDVQNSFQSPNVDGRVIVDLGAEYELAGIRAYLTENVRLYLCAEYPDGELQNRDLVYTFDKLSEGDILVDCRKSARYICLAATDITVKCAEIEVYAYVPDGGEISASELVDLESSYPSENNYSGVTNIGTYDNIIIAFSEDIITSYLNNGSVLLLDKNGISLPYTGLEVLSKEARIPISNLESNTAYSLIIKKGIVTKAGKMLTDDFMIEFTTGTLKTQVDLAGIIAGVTPADGSDNVTNLESYGFVKIAFSADVLVSSLADGVVIKSDDGRSVEDAECVFENNEYKLDLSCLSSNTKYTLTLKADTIKADGCDITGEDISITFTTGYIFPYKSIEGYRITNVALNKKIYSNASKQDTLSNINDGNYDNFFILNHTGGGGMNVIDLGNYYKVIAVQYVASNRFNYDTSTDNHYHTRDTKIYSSCEYPNNEYSNAILLHTTKAHLSGEKTLIKNTGDEYVRYITTVSRYGTSVYAELEAYAYVKENYMPITYEITKSECIASASIKNYTSDDKDVYMVISAYDEKGNFIGLKCKKFVAAANKTTPVEARYSLLEIKDSLLSANVKKVVIQLISGFSECKSLAVPVEVIS